MSLSGSSSDKIYLWATAGLVTLSLILVFESSKRQSLTPDESNHFYCGLEWWQKGSYTVWPENPVLSRAVVGLGAYLQGYEPSRFTVQRDSATVMENFLNAYDLVYFEQGVAEDQIFWIRIFVLPMFLLSILIVWYWSVRLSGYSGAFLAVGIYATLPIIMAHSGLATTDVTFVACFTLLMWTFFRWLPRPSPRRSIAFAAGLAMAVLAKYSVLPFFAIAGAIALIFYLTKELKSEQPTTPFLSKRRLWSVLMILFLMIGIVWAFHGFSIGRIENEPIIKTGIATGEIDPALKGIVLPAPEWFAGLELLLWHNRLGHVAYSLGEISFEGFWYFYPLAWLTKTPWPFLLLALAGTAGAWWPPLKSRSWEVQALTIIPIAMTISVMTSTINIGLRHILVVYPLGAVGISAGFMELLKVLPDRYGQIKKFLAPAFVVWQLVIAIAAFPNYLAYFNAFAGGEPGKVLLDSDLDWGQGLIELSEFSKANDIDTLHLAYFGYTNDCFYDLPVIRHLPPDKVVSGWVAVSALNYWGVFEGEIIPDGDCQVLSFKFDPPEKPHSRYRWLDQYELKTRAGGSIRVYHVP